MTAEEFNHKRQLMLDLILEARIIAKELSLEERAAVEQAMKEIPACFDNNDKKTYEELWIVSATANTNRMSLETVWQTLNNELYRISNSVTEK